MKKILLLTTIISCIFGFSSCRYDNYDAPQSMLTGRVVFDGEPVSVRSGSSEFALYQDGYALHNAIPVYVNQDGTYSACLFDGEYKLVRMGNAPWERPNNDTIIINVKGNTVMDIPVIPYYIIKDYSFAKNGNKITAKFKVEKVSESATFEKVRIYLGETLLLDNNNRSVYESIYEENIDFTQENTAEIEIPESLMNEDFIYVRLGVKSYQSSEFCYSQSTKIELK